VSFIAGQYLVTFGDTTPVTLGQVNGGITIEHFMNKQLITGDNYGQTPQDAVNQGAECFMEFVCMEYDNNALHLAMWPYQTDLATPPAHAPYGTLGVTGQTDVGSGMATNLVLTAVTGTPARPVIASGTPSSITATRAVLAEGFPVRLLYAPALREIPLRFRLYPSSSGVFFSLINTPA
jgi:hypothetical protein